MIFVGNCDHSAHAVRASIGLAPAPRQGQKTCHISLLQSATMSPDDLCMSRPVSHTAVLRRRRAPGQREHIDHPPNTVVLVTFAVVLCLRKWDPLHNWIYDAPSRHEHLQNVKTSTSRLRCFRKVYQAVSHICTVS